MAKTHHIDIRGQCFDCEDRGDLIRAIEDFLERNVSAHQEDTKDIDGSKVVHYNIKVRLEKQTQM